MICQVAYMEPCRVLCALLHLWGYPWVVKNLSLTLKDFSFLILLLCLEDMNTRTANARRMEEDNENQGALPQAPINTSAISNVEVRLAFEMLDQALVAQANRDVDSYES
ncbi:hypothetical protein MTR67_052087 [Solanum verrucosum]|uniref:Uncharacterized protein n=1 Tax=Solanum verrucosum TaxID=315347 RepID=A0AAF0V5K7_SOLVR|nr:hypothetical protein MTR67_052087 [Solanum verrucosum]